MFSVGSEAKRQNPIGLLGIGFDFGEVAGSENFQRFIGGGGDEQFSVRRIGEPQDSVFVGDERVDESAALRTERPDSDGLIESAGSNEFAGGVDGNRI